MQRIRPVVGVLTSTIGVEHALASKKLYTDGAEVLLDYASKRAEDELPKLTVVRTGQRQFTDSSRPQGSRDPRDHLEHPRSALLLGADFHWAVDGLTV
jgi:hypothetical protein